MSYHLKTLLTLTEGDWNKLVTPCSRKGWFRFNLVLDSPFYFKMDKFGFITK